MTLKYYLVCVLVMAAVTYLIRALPFAAVRGKLKSKFARSFLYYVPYAVLGAMTFPDVFYSTGNILSAAAGVAVGITLSYFKRSLLTVAVCASAAAYLVSILV